jgi:predicted Zn-dependent peptidase
MKRQFLLMLGLLMMSLGVASAQGFTSYKLQNGLTVYLWEDANLPTVFGSVMVRAGAVDEPNEYTGLAHYLEHVMFKGTQTIGALDWEKEKPLYEQIIRLYDEFADTQDPVKRAELEKRINEVSLEAAQFGSTNEFSNLVQSLGGEGLNAGTSYDQTVYYNEFPAFMMERWLALNVERFFNPVFRTFQAELENVYEEYNMYEDQSSTHLRKFIFGHLYEGHPYSRDIIGFPEHLKNPRLSKLIDYYNTWYVPNNMGLVLIGNFDAEKTKPLIESYFGRLQAKPLPERPSYPETDFSKHPSYKAKIGLQPTVLWGYKAVGMGDEDQLMLEFCSNLLSNSMNTGLLDKITMDGDVQYASSMMEARRDRGRFLIQAVPYYDVNQRLYESDKATEKVVMEQVNKLKSGELEDWLIESVKNEQLRSYVMMSENATGKFSILRNLFSYQLSDDYYDKALATIKGVTKEDVKRVAQKYITDNYMTLSIDEGTPSKDKLKKPAIEPIKSPDGKKSAYCDQLAKIPTEPFSVTYNDFSSVATAPLYEGVRLHHTTNPLNNYFSLTLRYGIGTEKMPKLRYASQMMNAVGIMPSDDPQSVRRQLSELNASCSFNVTEDYFYITIIGSDDNLKDICTLVTRMILLPKVEEKQLNRVVGSELSQRLMVERKTPDILSDALLEYAMYKDKSSYIDRVSLSDVYNLKQSDLAGTIIRATNYELDIHYVGKLPFDEAKEVLIANLPLKEGVMKSESPLIKPRISYDKPMLYFLPNNDSKQAQLYFYFEGEPYDVADEVTYRAFREYFSGGFNGLVMQEVREKRSMAYTAGGLFVTPPLNGKNTYFIGYIGTQPDKAADAVDVFMGLLKDMPAYPERMDDLKVYLKQSYLSEKPSFRNRSQQFADWKQLGYSEDPAKVNADKIDAINFDDVRRFYEKHVKGKPVSVIIMGDPKMINQKQLQSTYGKLTKMSTNKLFSPNVFE